MYFGVIVLHMDETEELRKAFVAQNTAAVQSDDKESERKRLVDIHGPENVYDTDQVRENFEVISFAAPFVSVVRKCDGVKGWLEFQHSPRLYFNFQPK